MLLSLMDGFVDILGRHLMVAVGKAVEQHDGGNILARKVFAPLKTLVIHGQATIGSTRANDDGTCRMTIRARGEKDMHLRTDVAQHNKMATMKAVFFVIWLFHWVLDDKSTKSCPLMAEKM